MFQRVGGAAYKKDLSNTLKLCQILGNPEEKFKSVHVAGTNGKGSCSHYLAGILQSSGYKTGLYTSPHLKNFSERIKVDGNEIDQEAIVSFMNTHYKAINEIKPSFFEITVVMAFDYFVKQNVDIAVIEVGMGGRLDSTNVIRPEVGLITNISLDHQQWLGNSIEEIAIEKAGIIKSDIPIVIGENQEPIKGLFIDIANKRNSQITFAYEHYITDIKDDFVTIKGHEDREFKIPNNNTADYQARNITSVIQVVGVLKDRGYSISNGAIIKGIERMKSLTGLKGRWQILSQNPKIICDVGHNEAGLSFIAEQLAKESFKELHIVWGTVNDKDIKEILKLLPKNAKYYFCQADIPRALDASELKELATEIGFKGEAFKTVSEAFQKAVLTADTNDLIFIGGSNFVVAELDL